MRRLSTLSATLLLSACSLQPLNERMESIYDERGGYAHISAVAAKQLDNGETWVMSAIRTHGDDPRVLRGYQLADVARHDTSWGKLTIVSPAGQRDALVDQLGGLGDNREWIFEAIESAIGRRLSTMDELATRPVELVFFAATGDAAYNHVRLTRLDGPMVEVVVAAAARTDLSVPDWWANQTRIAAHELAHLNHQLLGFGHENGDERTTNSEAAANVIGFCAYQHLIDLMLQASDRERRYPSDGFTLRGGAEVLSVFPAHARGDLTPDTERLERISEDPHTQAVILSTMISYALYQRLANTDDIEAGFQSMQKICDRMSNRIPDFLAGEVPGFEPELSVQQRDGLRRGADGG